MDAFIEATPALADAHSLEPLLNPRSIAFVGASPRKGSVGHTMVRSILESGYDGAVHLINPKYDEIEGQICLPSLQALEEAPDLVVAGVGPARMEEVFETAVAAGARAVNIFDACFGSASTGETLVAYLRRRAGELDLPVCGGNGMGFLNVAGRCHVTFYDNLDVKPGGISLIAHSGSVFTVLGFNDPRYRFNFIISGGQEIGASLDQYMDYLLDQPETRVIALFMEAARRPQAFRAALVKAQKLGVPVVACKVGRTEESAQFARSHSGALSGSDAAYDAVFEHYGAIRVDTVDQLLNTAMLFEKGREAGVGSLGVVTDSGGLRELLADRAPARGVPLAKFTARTRQALEAVLPPDLVPENPVDAAGQIDEGFADAFENALSIVGAAPEVAALAYEIDARDTYVYDPELLDAAFALPRTCVKPCLVYSSLGNTHNRELASRLADKGVPVLNGLDEMLSAVGNLFRRRDLQADAAFLERTPAVPEAAETASADCRLEPGVTLTEADSLAILKAFAIPAVGHEHASSLQAAHSAAERAGYPVVLKTAAEGIAHKSDMGGVRLNLRDPDELESAYGEMAEALGSNVLVQPMLPEGVELAFGCVHDADFGPVVMVSAGGTLIELMDDRVHALPPFGPQAAARLIGRLRVAKLLKGVRGAEPADMGALAQALSRFSIMCAGLGPRLAEADVNPVIALPDRCVAVDALLVGG